MSKRNWVEIDWRWQISSPSGAVRAATAVWGALVAVAVGGRAEEMRCKLGDARERLAWAEVDGEGKHTAALACYHGRWSRLCSLLPFDRK
jgi:hypothetical protein